MASASAVDRTVVEVVVRPQSAARAWLDGFDRPWPSVRLEARQVPDFHWLDKSQVFALHHGAVQELDRRLEATERRAEDAEERLRRTEAEMALLTGKLHLLLSSQQ